MGRPAPLQSSLPLQVVLYFDQYYFLLYVLLGICTFVYKGVVYPYPTSIIGWEAAGLAFFAVIQIVRTQLGCKGNLLQQVAPLFLSVLLALPSVAALAYYLEFQTYVLRIDQIANVIGLVFVCTEVLLAVFVMVAFLRRPLV